MLNSNRAQYIFIGTRSVIKRIPSDTQLMFDNISITPSTRVKNLGVIVDRHMNLEAHIHEMHKRVMGHLLFLNRIKDKFDSERRKAVVESIALSAINY